MNTTNKIEYLLMLSANLFSTFVQWLFVVLLAHYSNVEEIGKYSLVLSISGPLFMFLNFQLRTVLTADPAALFNFPLYFSIRLFCTLIALLGSLSFGGLFFSKEMPILLLLCVCSIRVFENISDISYGLFQHFNKYRYISFSIFARSFFYVFLFYVLVSNNNTIVKVFAVLSMIACASAAWDTKKAFILIKIHFLKLNIDKSKALITIRKVFPLGISSLLISLQSNIPRYYLGKNSSPELLGKYTAVIYLAYLTSIIVSSICQVDIPKMSKALYLKNKKDFFTVLKRMYIINFIFGFLGLLFMYYFGSNFIRYIYKINDADIIDIAKIMIGSILLSSVTIGNNIIIVIGLYRTQLIISTGITLITIALSSYLIMHYGLSGAYTTFLTVAFIYFLLVHAVIYIILRGRIFNDQ